jgi:hypothetical protein
MKQRNIRAFMQNGGGLAGLTNIDPDQIGSDPLDRDRTAGNATAGRVAADTPASGDTRQSSDELTRLATRFARGCSGRCS